MSSRRVLFTLAFLTAFFVLPGLVFGHPGHHHHAHEPGFLAGLLHPITGLDHLLAALAIGAWGALLGGQQRWQLPLAFVGALLVGAVAALLGLAIPAVHLFSALSVVLLGAAIALSLKWPQVAAIGAVSLFGLFHGGAHFEALTAFSAHTALYTGALVFSTGILHLGGALLSQRFLVEKSHAAPRYAGASVAIFGVILVGFQLF